MVLVCVNLKGACSSSGLDRKNEQGRKMVIRLATVPTILKLLAIKK